MQKQKYTIKLSSEERQELTKISQQHKVAAQKKQRAKLLLACDRSELGPAQTDLAIATELGIHESTVQDVRAWACEVGPLGALERRPTTRVYTRKLDGAGEARLVQIACSTPPEGRGSWTMQLLADKLIELHVVDAISDDCVHRTLKKTTSNLILVGTG